MKTCKSGLHTYDKALARCPECKALHRQQWQQKNAGRHKETNRLWYERNKERLRNKFAEYYQERKEQHNEMTSRYYQANKTKILGQTKEYVKRRRKTDSVYREIKRVRCVLSNGLRRGRFSAVAKLLLGCDIDELLIHLERTAITNYGSIIDAPGIYQIDHIIPYSAAKSKEDVIRLSHYSNLQLLYPEDNMEKGRKYE